MPAPTAPAPGPSSLRARALALGRSLLDLLFPPRCGGCNAPGHWLCPQCWDKFVWLEPPLCNQCGIPLEQDGLCPACAAHPRPYFHIRSAVFFEGPSRQAIHRLKYNGRTAVAGPLALAMYEAWKRERPPAQVVVPVPLHPTRVRERGFDQAVLLAREFSRLVELPTAQSELQRIRATPPQVGLSRSERQQNVEGAFHCPGRALEGQHVLLVDDVCTTGATLRAAALALREAGVQEIWAFTVARPRPGPDASWTLDAAFRGED